MGVLASAAVVLAVVLAAVVVRLARRPVDGVEALDGRLGRAAVAIAVVGLVALAVPWLIEATVRRTPGEPAGTPMGVLLLSIVCGFAAAILGAHALLREHERHWTAWAGLAVGGVIALFWVAFAVGSVLWGR